MTPDERVTLLAWDDAGGMFLRAEITVGGDPAAATAAVLVWVGARPVYAFGLAVETTGAGAGAGFVVGGLRVLDVDGPISTLELDDGPNTISLRFEPFTDPWPGRSAAGPLTVGHDERACRVTGRVEVSGHAVEVDGVGQRRRSSGPATEGSPTGWRSITGYLGPSSRPVGGPATELAFQVWEVGPAAAGFVHDAGVDQHLMGADDVDGDPLHLALADAGGRRRTVRGHRHGLEVPVRPAGAGAGDTAVLRLQLVRWEAEGLDGYGLVERLDAAGAPPTGDGATP